MGRRLWLFVLLCALCWHVRALSQGVPQGMKKFRIPELDAVLLADTELPPFTLVNQNRFHWWKGQDRDGSGVFQIGVSQSFTDPRARRLFIGFARLPDSVQARRAAEHYPNSVAAVFRRGLWDGWEKMTIGDSCWVTVRSTEAGLMVQQGTLCVLITCHVEDPQEAQRLAFCVAQKILAKEARRNKRQEGPEGDKGRD